VKDLLPIARFAVKELCETDTSPSKLHMSGLEIDFRHVNNSCELVRVRFFGRAHVEGAKDIVRAGHCHTGRRLACGEVIYDSSWGPGPWALDDVPIVLVTATYVYGILGPDNNFLSPEMEPLQVEPTTDVISASANDNHWSVGGLEEENAQFWLDRGLTCDELFLDRIKVDNLPVFRFWDVELRRGTHDAAKMVDQEDAQGIAHQPDVTTRTQRVGCSPRASSFLDYAQSVHKSKTKLLKNTLGLASSSRRLMAEA